MGNEEVEEEMEQDQVLGFLEHFGVKGMHWGVRRSVGPNGRVIGKSKPKPSSDFKTTAPLRKRPPHTLSNMQLKKVNERMQLEQKFSKMNPSRKQKGKEFLDDALKAAVGVGGTAAVFKIATDPKFQAAVQTGIKAVAFRTSSTGRLLTQVRKGKFG